MIELNEPLSDQEIAELDEFLMSDATPEESMDIVTLDGFLTSLVIGPEVVPPSVWLKRIWGGEEEPRFESSEQAPRVISLIMRRFNTLSFLFEEPPEFAPILWEREVGGTTYRIADDWCWGFMAGVSLASEAWQPLVTDTENRAMLRPIATLGTEDGWKLLEADIDPDAAEQAALDALEPAVIVISRYWRKQWRERSAALRQASIRPRSLRVGRNDPCPCGSGHKYKRCCANAEA
jgi:uncharacterized protein